MKFVSFVAATDRNLRKSKIWWCGDTAESVSNTTVLSLPLPRVPLRADPQKALKCTENAIKEALELKEVCALYPVLTTSDLCDNLYVFNPSLFLSCGTRR